MNDLVEDFLRKAERMAKEGERDTAYALLQAALNNAPGDPDVLERSRPIRALIRSLPSAPREEPRESPTPAVPDLASLPDLPMASSRIPAKSPTAVPEQAHNSSGLMFPLDSEAESSAPDRGTVPVQANRSNPVFHEPLAVSYDSSHSAGEEDRPSKSLVAVLAILVLLALGAAGMVVVRPDIVDNVVQYHQLTHPQDLVAEHMAANQWDEAEAQVEKMISADDRLVYALRLRGEIRLASGRVEDGVSDLIAAVNHPDASPELALEVADLIFQHGAAAEAGAAYERALDLGLPPEQWLMIAEHLVKSGRTARAIQVYRAIVRTVPKDREAARVALRSYGIELE